MDKLQAVNSLLKMIGTRKVTSLDIQHPDVTDAVDAIDEWVEKLLQKGWWFNKKVSQDFYPDVQKYIQLPAGTMSIEHGDYETARNYPFIAHRGGRLLNTDTSSFVFETPVNLTVYLNLPWEALPAAAQHWVQHSAGAYYVLDKIEDSAKSNTLLALARDYLIDLDAQQLRTQNINMNSSPGMQRFKRRVRPYGRGYGV